MDGSNFTFEIDGGRNYWSPNYNFKTKQLAVYGQGDYDSKLFYAEVLNGAYMDKPMAVGPFAVNHNIFKLDNEHVIDAYGVRGYFPNYLPAKRKLVSISEFSKVQLSNLDGSDMKEIFHTKNGLMLIGLSANGKGDLFTTAAGMPFASLHKNVDILKFTSNGNDINLTHGSNTNNTFPRFTKDGKHIIFRSGRLGYKNIYIMNADGTNIKRLTFDTGIDTMPSVSASGDKIIFSSARDGENYRIYMLEVKPDGTPGKLTKLTNGPGADVHPTFSPDEKWIAYASEREGLKDEMPLYPIFSPQPYGEIYIMRLSDKKIIPITDNKWEDSLPNWQRNIS